MLNDEPQWVAVYTEPNAEKQVAARFLERSIEHYLPLTRKARQWSDRLKMVDVPLFKGYIFAKITRRQVARVRDTTGAVLIISWGGQPATIPDCEIEFVRTMIQEEREVEVRNMGELCKGTHARITEGPFKGMKGVLLDDGDGAMFAIKIEALSACFATRVDKGMLQPLPPETKKKGMLE